MPVTHKGEEKGEEKEKGEDEQEGEEEEEGRGGGGQSASLANQPHCIDVFVLDATLLIREDGHTLKNVLEMQLSIAAVISGQ